MVTEFDHNRMDDDGAPPSDNRHILRIGIAPTPPPAPTEDELNEGMPRPRLIITGSDSGKAFDGRAEATVERPKLILPGEPESPAPAGLILPLSAKVEPESALTWAEYASWRKTKCHPPWDTELARATLELIGEVGELAELLLKEGPATFYGEARTKLIDECGDILFCASWALDAWGLNPLPDGDDIELLRVEEDSPLLLFTGAFIQNSLEAVMHSPNFLSGLSRLIYDAVAEMQTHAALTANSAKKRIYQQREQDIDKQVGRIVAVLLVVNKILIVANSNVEEALIANRTKLDARYPDGWHANVGGGIREGAGK